MKRFIAHVDMDAFFAAIEERDNPRFTGQPIVVGADPLRGRGVVSTASYAARKYGIGSGQSIKKAWQLSEAARWQGKPPVIFLPGSWRRYNAISHAIMDVIKKSAPVTQQRSVDEAYADISFLESEEAARAWGVEIKEKIFVDQRLQCSVGIGPNKLLAKIASDADKPNGLLIVSEANVEDFLAPLSIRVIPGVGPKTAEVLGRRGIKTVDDARKFSEEELCEWLGKWGGSLYRKVRGIDTSPVYEEHKRKSIGGERTFGSDFSSAGKAIDFISEISREVFAELQAEGFCGAKTVSIVVRFYDFTTTSSAHTLPVVATSVEQIQREALRLLLPFLDSRRNPFHKKIRLLGIRLEKLT